MPYIKIDNNDSVNPSAVRLEPLNRYPLGYLGNAGSIHLYRGERPSEAFLLLTSQVLTAINANVGPHQIDIFNDDDTLALSTDFWSVTDVEAVTQATGNDQLFFVTLKDPRHMTTTVGKTPAAVIANTWEEEIWPSNSTYTYQQVLSEYWSLLPSFNKASSGTCPTLGYTPVSYAENIWCEGETVWQCINRLLSACGNLGVFNPTTGQYSFLKRDDTQAGLAAAISGASARLIWDGDVPSGLNAGNSPASVGVSFRPSRTTQSFKLPHSTEEYGSSATLSTGLSGAKTGSVRYVTDTSRTKYCSETSIVKNITQLNNRATDLSKTVLGVSRSSHSKRVQVFSGVLAVLPGEEVSHVCYKTDKDYGFTTTVEQYEEFDIKLPEPRNEEWDVAKTLVFKTINEILAPTGDTPSQGLAQVYEMSGGVLTEIPHETATLFWIGAETIPARTLVLADLEFHDGRYFITTVGVSAGTTTTTTLVPPIPNECTGTCKWVSADGFTWSIDQDNCSNATTTSTSTTTSTTSAGTTTTPSPCATTTTTSTTTTSSGTCQCVPPTFCPIAVGDCATTYCDKNFSSSVQCNTTTSTTTTSSGCDCATTTTTTASPDCSLGCEWCLLPDGSITLENRCAPGCPCGPYPGGLSSVCTCVTSPCVPTTIPPDDPILCQGTCKWVCLGDGRGWWLDAFNSDCGIYGICRCSYPTDSGTCTCNSTAITPCGTPTTTTSAGTTTTTTADPCAACYTTTTTSTTTTADPCPGPCRYRWNSSAGMWVLVLSQCGTCGCSSAPSSPGTDDCEVVAVPCNLYTTTTSTTGTPTTTTATGACCYPSGGCAEMSSVDCAAVGGIFQGGGSTCASVDYCNGFKGACCVPYTGACYEGVTQSTCEAAGHTFQGTGTVCSGVSCAGLTTTTTTTTTTPTPTTTTACPCPYLSCGCAGGAADPLCSPGTAFSCVTCNCVATTTTTTGLPTPPPPPPP